MKEHFSNVGMEINGILQLSPHEAYEACKTGAIIVDIREEYETAGKKIDIANLIYMPNKTLANHFRELPAEKKLILTCSIGMRSKKAVEFLLEQGFPFVANLNGGILDWEKEKLPLKINKGEMLTGSCLCQLRPKKKFQSDN